MIKIFSGTDIEAIVKEIDEWMIANNASFYGSRAIRKRDLPDGSFEFTVNVKL
ncbi:hypothetical protein [Periweissella ghanensis]|uniref:Uncharacterized protein n=1 Tax=Periweissella ghanensis TaxID=467997 RepID=A0ABM8Z8N1_9LACO|nr:hypothetical protein [Periweissella ghanensis]MCM0600880.1 hypothetical protein [Periweissella ghanensis]CAH0417703.1 hypothetical protein WGH24286_00115 [Periweissella ghanensis]